MKTLFTIAILLISTNLYAQSIGSLAYGGSGCVRGTMTYSYLPAEHELVLNYNGFTARSGTAARKNLDRKTCSVTIPVQVPAGYQMALVTQSEGRAIVRSGGLATLNMESFYAGSRGVKNTRSYRTGQHAVSIGDSANTIAWSQCGESANLRMNVSAITQREASLSLKNLRFQLLLRACAE